MARLKDGEREQKESKILRLLKKLRLGLRESEISVELGWERRTVNNYLRQLSNNDKVEKDGRLWFLKK